MRKIQLLCVLLFLSIYIYAQREPGNNLGKSLAQIQQDFPNLKPLGDDEGYKVYKSSADGDDFTSFYFSNGRLVGEYTYIFDYSDSGYIRDLYNSLFNSFANKGGKYKRSTNSGYDVTFFFFSDFTIKIANYNTQLQLYYEKKGLYIKFNALQARPPRY